MKLTRKHKCSNLKSNKEALDWPTRNQTALGIDRSFEYLLKATTNPSFCLMEILVLS
jgi:hypothetical protein